MRDSSGELPMPGVRDEQALSYTKASRNATDPQNVKKRIHSEVSRGLIIGLHIRTSPNTPFLHFDHWAPIRNMENDYDDDDDDDDDDQEMDRFVERRLCFGDGRALRGITSCVKKIMRDHQVGKQKISLLFITLVKILVYGTMKSQLLPSSLPFI